MKHLKTLGVPAKAILPEGHPDLKDSIAGFLRDPIDVLDLHLDKNND